MGERSVVRAELDGLPDFFVAGNEVKFRKEFRTLASENSFCEVPLVVLVRARSLLDMELVDSVGKTAHDTVVFELGCSRLPLFLWRLEVEIDASSSSAAFSRYVLPSLKSACFPASSE